MASDLFRFLHAARTPVACAVLVLGTACSNLPPSLSAMLQPAQSADDGQTAPRGAAQTLQAAIEAAQPRRSNLAQARKLLNELLAAEDSESRRLQPYARALLDQIQERQRLTSANARLRQQLDAQSSRLQESEQSNAALQGKLDALAEIEGQLKPRTP